MPSPRPSICNLRGASAAIVGRAGRDGAKGLSAGDPCRCSRNELGAGSLETGANGFVAPFGAGRNGFDSDRGGGAKGLAAEPPVDRSAQPPSEPVKPAGSQFGRLALEPRSESSQ